MNKKGQRIFCVGDSVMWGSWDEAGGWVDRLKAHFNAEFISENGTINQIFNLGVGVANSQDILDRIETDIKPRISSNYDSVLILAVGINDSRFLPSGKNEIEIHQYEKNIQEIVKIAQEKCDHIYFVGINRVKGKRVNFKQYICVNDEIAKYDQVLKNIAHQHHIPLIDLAEIFNSKEELHSRDNAHPNSRAHQLIADKVIEFITR